ncbi:hypothetical protein GCM10007426_41660 [Alloalcanivorax dieselolei]|nr:hypothetical protein GCM10007426_41660 [Alloalcanivorax dieselolei]
MEEGKGIRLQADFPQQLERRRESVVGEGGAGKEKGSTRWIDPFLFGSACWARTRRIHWIRALINKRPWPLNQRTKKKGLPDG